MIQALIGPISSLASTWLEGKVEKGKAKVKADVAKAEAEAIVMQKKATGEIDWDLEMAKGSHNSWKDEWLVVLFSIPLILAFIPGMEGIVQNGFEQLEKCQNGINTVLGSLLLLPLGFAVLLSSLVGNNGRRNFGLNTGQSNVPKEQKVHGMGCTCNDDGSDCGCDCESREVCKCRSNPNDDVW